MNSKNGLNNGVGSWLRIGVKDTGYGIPEDKKDKLFSPFERFHPQAVSIEGTGIGLTISKQFIEMMNGTISFESTAGEGSFFYVDIPISNKTPLAQVETQTKPLQASLSRNDKKKILYIEDIPENIELVRQILSRREEIRLLSVSNAIDGIELAKSETPDLILMDIHLPGMGGLTAFKKLQTKNETKNIPVIALTADGMDGDINKALDMGFKGYLTKPIDVPKFLEVIDEVILK
jgi:CheY-like chemotaxis protein